MTYPLPAGRRSPTSCSPRNSLSWCSCDGYGQNASNSGRQPVTYLVSSSTADSCRSSSRNLDCHAVYGSGPGFRTCSGGHGGYRMSEPITGEWRAPLAAVERSIADCLTELERYEAAFHQALGEPITDRKPIALPAIADWDEKLAAAGRHADEVERLLSEQHAVWDSWRHKFTDWQKLVADAPESILSRRFSGDPHTN
jgi:hypothetical protein